MADVLEVGLKPPKYQVGVVSIAMQILRREGVLSESRQLGRSAPREGLYR